MDNSRLKMYLPGLNSLRFFAASVVIMSHIELFKMKWQLPNFYNVRIIEIIGGLGVDFFFVLSGFLITYLLLLEEKQIGTISLGKFYLRRILRIWPLYLVFILLVFFLLPAINYPSIPGLNISDDFLDRLVLFIVMMPNVSKAFYDFVPYGGVAWSVGVEEQFYLFWPIFLMFTKKKLKLILYMIVLLFGIKVILFVYSFYSHSTLFFQGLINLVVMTRFDIMGIGALGAFLVVTKSRYLFYLYSKRIQLAAYGLMLPTLFIFQGKLDGVIHHVMSLIFLIIILNISTNKMSIINVEYSWLNYFGRLSYGMYMYHMIVIGGVLDFVSIWNFEDNLIAFNVIIYCLVFLLTMLFSSISYHFYERPFLRLKDKLALIKTSTDGKP